ncbi:MAG: alpha/beta hydrolase [Gammaproteobacteria bacterium]|nr:alpha/beta hydrolase [Gammaproteobacteria bacterium]
MKIITANGVRLAVYEWRAELAGRQPTLVFVHATGFHGRCWDRVIEQLGDRHVLALDLRGHGRSEAAHFTSWQDFAVDLLQLLQQLGVRRAFGIGHSMGGHSIVNAATRDAALFSRLLLIDPTVFSAAFYQSFAGQQLAAEPSHFAARRRARFASVEEVQQRYRQRPPYSEFDHQVLADYCQYGVRQLAGQEGVELACAPAFEARIYDAGGLAGSNILARLSAVDIPVTVVRAMQAPSLQAARTDFRYSPTWPGLAGLFTQGTDVFLPEETHFLPLEKPELVAALIRNAETALPDAG